MVDKKLISRFKIIVKENGGQSNFSRMVDVSQTLVSRIISGERDMNADIILSCCIKLGYTPEWLILGTGDKKKPGKDSVKLVTEIQFFRTELEITNKRIDLLTARVKANDEELERIKNGLKNGGDIT